MRILITGGSGFIGSNLALKLNELGHDIVILDNLSKQIHGENPEITSPLYIAIRDKVTFIKGDVCNKADWEKALPGIEVVVHLAAETGTGQSMYEIERYAAVNSQGTSILLDILANKKDKTVRRIVVASSRAIYGEGRYYSEKFGYVFPESRKASDMQKGFFDVRIDGCDEVLTLCPTTEDSKIHPASVYGITKQVQEQLIMCVANAIGISAVSLRYQNVYGPGQSLKNPYTGILSIFSTLIKNNKGLNIFEDGKESRDFVYIEDVVQATVLAVTKEEAANNVYNVGSGVATSVLTVAHSLIKGYSVNVPVTITGNFRVGDIRHNYADISRIQQHLGFIPAYSFESGIERFIKWVNLQEITASHFDNSVEEMRKKGLLK